MVGGNIKNCQADNFSEGPGWGVVNSASSFKKIKPRDRTRFVLEHLFYLHFAQVAGLNGKRLSGGQF